MAQLHAFPSAGVAVTELPPAARFSLRLSSANIEAANRALGLSLPEKVGGIASGGSLRALCLGPDEWLLESEHASQPALPATLPHALVDISDREILFRIEGPRAMELLSIGIARDLRRLGVGQGCRTAFDSAQTILIRESAAVFTLSVWRSFASHVVELLQIGQREFSTGY